MTSCNAQVTKLGYSELDSVLGFAPKLLDYLGSPERPSLLAKIFGIYTLKFVDVKTGKKRKVDLILMEHLFFGKSALSLACCAVLHLLNTDEVSAAISRQFDLKGASPTCGPRAAAQTYTPSSRRHRQSRRQAKARRRNQRQHWMARRLAHWYVLARPQTFKRDELILSNPTGSMRDQLLIYPVRQASESGAALCADDPDTRSTRRRSCGMPLPTTSSSSARTAASTSACWSGSTMLLKSSSSDSSTRSEVSSGLLCARKCSPN